jgi:hypothetical protein
MASEKTVTYTAEQTTALVEGYTSGQTVEALATALGKSVRSVVAKLSREGVYKAKAKAEGTPARLTKAQLVSLVEGALDMPKGTFESLEKGTHEALEALAKRLTVA